MNYYIKNDDKINPRCFTVCTSDKCDVEDCFRNQCNHTADTTFSTANLFVDCSRYSKKKIVDSKDNL